MEKVRSWCGQPSDRGRLKNRTIWLLTAPPHLKYVATLPCNLSLMACFADIDVSQGNIATYARCDDIFNIHLTANLLMNLPVNFLKSVKIWQNYGHESVAPLFGPPCRHRDIGELRVAAIAFLRRQWDYSCTCIILWVETFRIPLVEGVRAAGRS